MFTLILAWINAKYKYDYEILFGITAFLDVMTIIMIAQLLGLE